MLDIKKEQNNATMTTTIRDADSWEHTIAELVHYVKTVKELERSGYNEFGFDTVLRWLSHGKFEGDDMGLENLTLWADFVFNVEGITSDNYTVMELVYLYEETRERLNTEE